MRCPNGTTSTVGATTIYDCVLSDSSTIDDVLLRVRPFSADNRFLRYTLPATTPSPTPAPNRRLDAAPASALDDPDFVQVPKRLVPYEMPYLTLRAWDVATITIDLRGLSTNITYYDHWTFGIYEDCQPCPGRYQCNYQFDPPTCGLSEADQRQYGVLCSDCCSCRKKVMPAYFETYSSKTAFVTKTLSNPNVTYPYLDDKHKLLAITLTALQDTTVVFSLELLHGLYIGDFNKNFENTADIKYVSRSVRRLCVRRHVCPVAAT